jgi:hypothetical protein
MRSVIPGVELRFEQVQCPGQREKDHKGDAKKASEKMPTPDRSVTWPFSFF